MVQMWFFFGQGWNIDVFPHAQDHSMPQSGLFDSVPEDLFQFGHGVAFMPRKVSHLLGFKIEDVSHLASVSAKSVRYDDALPDQVRERLEDIATTINLVARVLDGGLDKTLALFKTRPPFLGDIAPREMIRLGRYERLRKFIIHAMNEQSKLP